MQGQPPSPLRSPYVYPQSGYGHPYGYTAVSPPATSPSTLPFLCQSLHYEATSIVQTYIHSMNGKFMIYLEGLPKVKEMLMKLQAFTHYMYQNYGHQFNTSNTSNTSNNAKAGDELFPIQQINSLLFLQKKMILALEQSHVPMMNTFTSSSQNNTINTMNCGGTNDTSKSIEGTITVSPMNDVKVMSHRDGDVFNREKEGHSDSRASNVDVEDVISDVFVDKSLALPSIVQLVDAFEKLQNKHFEKIKYITQKNEGSGDVQTIQGDKTKEVAPLFTLLRNDVEDGLLSVIPPENCLAVIRVDVRSLINTEDSDKSSNNEQKQRVSTRNTSEEKEELFMSLKLENQKLPEAEDILWNMCDAASSLYAFCESYCREFGLPNALKVILLTDLRKQIRKAIEIENDFSLLVEFWKRHESSPPINFSAAVRTIELEVSDDKFGCRYEDKFKWNLLNTDDDIVNLISRSIEDMQWPFSVKWPLIIAFKRQVQQHKQELVNEKKTSLRYFANADGLDIPFAIRSKSYDAYNTTRGSSDCKQEEDKKRIKLERKRHSLKKKVFRNYDVWRKRIEATRRGGPLQLRYKRVNSYLNLSPHPPLSAPSPSPPPTSAAQNMMHNSECPSVSPTSSTASKEFDETFIMKEIWRRKNWEYYMRHPLTPPSLPTAECVVEETSIHSKQLNEIQSTTSKNNKARQRDYLLNEISRRAPQMSGYLNGGVGGVGTSSLKPLASGLVVRTEIEREEWGPICWNGEEYYYCVQGMRRPKRRRR